jgi:hypothetical protein
VIALVLLRWHIAITHRGVLRQTERHECVDDVVVGAGIWRPRTHHAYAHAAAALRRARLQLDDSARLVDTITECARDVRNVLCIRVSVCARRRQCIAFSIVPI